MVVLRWVVAATTVLVAVRVADAQPASGAGTVVDGTTGRPVRGATIAVDPSTPLATTDREGRFVLGAIDPDATLIVEAQGYETALVAAAEVLGGAAEVVLLPLGTSSELIEVEAEAPPAAPGATQLQRDEIEHVPGTGGDLIASLDALPGVTGGAQRGFSGVVIRGSAPEDSKILVDGFEIPLLYHIGLRSVIPTAAIAGLEYLPGGFDVAYGRASSGIVKVTTRGGERTLGGQFETSVIDGGALARGPVGKRATFLVAARRSVIDLVLPSLIPDDADLQLSTVPHYWDGQIRIDYEPSAAWKTSLSLLGTTDALELIADDEADPDERFYLQTAFARLIADARYHQGGWSATLAASPIVQRTHFEFGRDVYYRADKLGVGVRGELARSWSRAGGATDVVARAGAEVDLARWSLDLALPVFEDEGEPEMEVGPPTDPTTFFADAIWVPDVAAWTAIEGNLDPRIRVIAGLRVDGFVRTHDVAVQPRGELSFAASPRTKLRLVAGAYRRPAEYLQELLDDGLDPERATQVIAGIEHRPVRGLTIQGSLYYTDRTALLTRADDGGYANEGRGTTVGAEVMATLRSGPWFGFVSYALSRSTRVDRPGADQRLFDHDQTHDVNVALTWRHGAWQLGGRFQYTSGKPTTDVEGAYFDSDADRYVPLFGPINAVRMPPHHQLDLRIDRSFHIGGMKLTGFLDVQNVYLNAEIINYEYNFDYTERVVVEGLPILPSIGLRGEL